jgi:hypothetical protein
MHHSLFIDAWLGLWLRATPWNQLAPFSHPDVIRGWIENWCTLTGMVPRSLYLEVLERKEVLRTRLEEAEATIQQLRGTKRFEAQGNEIVSAWETAINLWQMAVQSTVKAQNEWMRSWTDFALNNNHQQRG